MDNAKKQIDEYLDPERGTIKIGFPTSLSSHLMPSVISAFKDEYPDARFQLRQGAYRYLIDSVKKGDIQIAFLGPVPKDEPDIERKRVSLHDMKSDLFVSFPEGYALNKITMDASSQAGFTPTIFAEGEDLDAIKGFVAAGMGVTLLPESTFHESTPRMTVKKPLEIPEVRRTVGIIKPKENTGTIRKSVLRFCKTIFLTVAAISIVDFSNIGIWQYSLLPLVYMKYETDQVMKIGRVHYIHSYNNSKQQTEGGRMAAEHE